MDTTHTVSTNDGRLMSYALFEVYGLGDRDLIGCMMCDADTARQRIINALNAIGSDAITDATLIVSRRAVIECSMIAIDDDQRNTFAKLNVRLAAMLEGVTI